MKLLITGHSGFIGTNLVNSLKNYNNVVLKFLGRATIPNWDTLADVDDSDVIIHLAGLAHDFKKEFQWNDYYQANYLLTRKVYDLFLASNQSKTFIFVSTIAVNGNIQSRFTEECSPVPITDYGKSKLMAENYILNNLPKYKQVYILRPCMVHGEGDKGNLTQLYDFLMKGLPYPLAKFKNRRSFLGVDNLLFILKELTLYSNIPSGIYHLADDESVATVDLVKLICEIKNKKTKLWRLPKIFVRVLAKVGDTFDISFNTERLEKMTEDFVISNKKIKDALQKDLPETSISGLRKTIISFK